MRKAFISAVAAHALAITACSSAVAAEGSAVDRTEVKLAGTYELDGITITEGYAPFGEFQTYFRIAGDVTSSKPPLLLLHGGPGSTHNYFEVLDRLANETGRAIISCD